MVRGAVSSQISIIWSSIWLCSCEIATFVCWFPYQFVEAVANARHQHCPLRWLMLNYSFILRTRIDQLNRYITYLKKNFWRSSHWQKACLSLDLKTPWTGNLQSTASCWVFKAGPQFKFLRKQGQGLMELTFHYILVLSTWNAGWRQRTWRASWDKRTNHVSVSLKHRFSVWTREFSNKKRTHHIQANVG